MIESMGIRIKKKLELEIRNRKAREKEIQWQTMQQFKSK